MRYPARLIIGAVSFVAGLLLLPHIALLNSKSNAEPAQIFSDIPQTSRSFIPANYLKEKGLSDGYSDGTFHPERMVSRAEALAMILKATGASDKSKSEDHTKDVNKANPLQISLPKASVITVQNLYTGEKTTFNNITTFKIEADETGTTTLKILKKRPKKPFRDVSEKDWFFDIVEEAKKQGIVKGVNGSLYFKPNESVNLAETLRMLFKSSGVSTELTEMPLPPDISPDAWYAKDIAHALSATIITQQENGAIFPPHEKLNRGELAMLLYRFLQTKNNISFGYASWYGDGLAKTKLTSGTDYAERSLTAAHKTLAFGSIVRVTNMANGKYVDVVINDRGPFVTGRIIDLSKSAFSALETPSAGIIGVQIQPLSF